MRFLPLFCIVALTLPAVCDGQSTNQRIQELHRTVAQLEDTVARLKASMDEKMIELKLLVQQSLDSSNKAATAVTIFEGQLRERLNQQEKSVAGPVAGLGTRLDTLADEFRFVRENITDLNTKLSRLETKMVDIDTAVKTIQAPPPPPGLGPASDTPPPGLSSEKLFQDAHADKLRGNDDLALQQFQAYLRWFPTTSQACQAQYYIGEVYYGKGNYDLALQAFDAVLEKYPASDCDKTADAQFQKGKTLAKLGQKTAAASEFHALKSKFPRGSWVAKANAELRALGMSTTIPPRGGGPK